MGRKRMAQSARQDMIIDHATRLFAERGYHGLTTSALARAVGVSEALLFQHFPNKDAIFRAVIERSRERQALWRDAMGATGLAQSTEGLVGSIAAFLTCCLDDRFIALFAPMARLTLASMVGDGDYARSGYLRNHALHREAFGGAMRAADAAGSFTQPAIDPSNAIAFCEHVGSMLIFMRLPGEPIAVYGGEDAAVLGDAVRFCCRGIGLSSEAVERHLPAALEAARRRMEDQIGRLAAGPAEDA